jgi:hypothetical protein
MGKDVGGRKSCQECVSAWDSVQECKRRESKHVLSDHSISGSVECPLPPTKYQFREIEIGKEFMNLEIYLSQRNPSPVAHYRPPTSEESGWTSWKIHLTRISWILWIWISRLLLSFYNNPSVSCLTLLNMRIWFSYSCVSHVPVTGTMGSRAFVGYSNEAITLPLYAKSSAIYWKIVTETRFLTLFRTDAKYSATESPIKEFSKSLMCWMYNNNSCLLCPWSSSVIAPILLDQATRVMYSHFRHFDGFSMRV